jgi:tripartite-type tricarboxylate transporter receptor subunit TctC
MIFKIFKTILILISAWPGISFAQTDYPNKPIKVIIAWPPSSAIDTVMRRITDALKDELGQPIVVENKAGAAGALGSAFVANAPADGYTLLFNSAAMNMLAAMGTQTPYKMPEAFTPIVHVFSSPMVLVSNPALDVKTLQDLVALATARQGNMFYSSTGHGGPSHFAAELFRARTGIKATQVPTKGSPEAMLELIAGRVDFYFAVASTALPPAKSVSQLHQTYRPWRRWATPTSMQVTGMVFLRLKACPSPSQTAWRWLLTKSWQNPRCKRSC